MDAELAIGMHLLAGGLVWLVPQSNQDHVRSELFDCLRSRLPEVFLPDAPGSLSSAPEVGGLCRLIQHLHALCSHLVLCEPSILSDGHVQAADLDSSAATVGA